MRKIIVTALFLITAACGDTSTTSTTSAPDVSQISAPTSTEAPATEPPTTDPPTTTAPSSTTTAATTSAVPTGGNPAIQIDEIVFAGSPYVIITNRGDGVGSTEGHFLCRFPDYYELPAVELLPGERLAVPLGQEEIPDLIGVVAVADVRSPLGSISASDDELGLYSRNEFNSDDAIIDYVEWGSAGHARSNVAIAAGIWVVDGFVELPEEALAIVAQNFPTASPEDWFAEIGG